MKPRVGDQFEIQACLSFHDFSLGSTVEIVKVINKYSQYRLKGQVWYECKLIKGTFDFFEMYNDDKENPESFCIINVISDFKQK